MLSGAEGTDAVLPLHGTVTRALGALIAHLRGFGLVKLIASSTVRTLAQDRYVSVRVEVGW